MKITAMPELPASGGNIQTINQPHTSESPQPVAPVVTETPKAEDEKFSAKYAELAKQEKTLRSKIQTREAALKQREEALKARETEYETNYIPKSQIPQMFEKDPYQAMRDFGLSGEKLTHALLNQPSPQDQMIQALQAQIAKLEDGQNQTKTMISDHDKRAREQAVSQIRTDVKGLVASDPEFEIIKSTGSEDAVVEFIEKKFDEEGVLYSIEDAAKAVEAELNEELFKYSQLQKIQDRLKAQNPPEVSGSPSGKLPPNPLKTLASSQLSSTTRPLSARDRAIALLEGKQI